MPRDESGDVSARTSRITNWKLARAMTNITYVISESYADV
jgi:hypothetical protein